MTAQAQVQDAVQDAPAAVDADAATAPGPVDQNTKEGDE